MAKRIEIRLADNPSNTDYFTFLMVVPSEFYSSTTSFSYRTTPSASNHIQIGANLAATITNTVTVLNSYFTANSWINFTAVSGGVDGFVSPSDTSFTTIGSPTQGDITLNFVTVTVEAFTRDNIILSRSPFNISIAPTELFDRANLNISIYRGERTVDAPATQTLPFSKSVIQAGQTEINFDIHKQINDYVKNSIIDFGDGINTSSSYDSVWVDCEISAYYFDAILGTVNKQFLAIDGFGWHTELSNPKLTTNVLSSITEHIFYRGSDYPLYFVTKDLQEITVNGTSIPFTLNEDLNNQLIAYINVGAYASTLTDIEVIFSYDLGDETHNLKILDVCNYQLYNCFFKNKYGFWQSIPFERRSRNTRTVEESQFKQNISTYGRYSLKNHVTKSYNTESSETIMVNTNFLPENYNILFEELLESEFIYLESNGQYLPVNKETKTWQKKTKLNDKLIQYSMDFKYAFNKINKIN